MFRPADLPETIPVFPLPGALLFPRARLPLNIFEPRYLSMLEDTLKSGHRIIGMVQPLPNEGTPDAPKLHNVGCAGRIKSFAEMDDGRYRISLNGISRFEISEVEDGFTPYLKARVNWDPYAADLGREEHDPSFKRDQFFNLLNGFFKIAGMESDWESLKKADDEMLINSLSMLCPFDIEDKQALLEAKTLTQRRETFVTLLQFALAQGNDGGALQ